MRNGQQRAVEIVQRVFQHLARVHVQMVRGLVHKQEVVLAQHQLGQRQPAALTARKRVDFLEHIVASEQEQGQHAAHAVGVQAGEIVPQFVEHILIRMEARLVLVVIADIDVRAKLHGAAIRRFLAHEDAQKRGLAHAVGADQRYAVARAQMQAEVLEELPAIVALAQIFGDQHILARAAARLEGKAHLILAHGFFQAHDFFQPLFAAFRRLDGFFAVEHAVARDDRLLPGDFRLLQLVFLELAL